MKGQDITIFDCRIVVLRHIYNPVNGVIPSKSGSSERVHGYLSLNVHTIKITPPPQTELFTGY